MQARYTPLLLLLLLLAGFLSECLLVRDGLLQLPACFFSDSDIDDIVTHLYTSSYCDGLLHDFTRFNREQTQSAEGDEAPPLSGKFSPRSTVRACVRLFR